MKYKKQSTVINTCYCKITFIQHIAFSVFSTLYCFTEWGTISNNSVHKLLKLNHKLIQTILLTCLNNSNFQKSDSFWQSPLYWKIVKIIASLFGNTGSLEKLATTYIFPNLQKIYMQFTAVTNWNEHYWQ